MKNINWAVLGTGVIANEMAVALKKNGKNIYAVGNRTHEKAVIFAEKYGIGKVYADYNEMFTDPDVDVIYITTPHNTHLNFMKKAIENGKHILVEKSITLNSDELNEALTLAEEKGVMTFERDSQGYVVKPRYQLISSHTCRRSCITNMYKSGKYTIPVMMSVSGHRDERTFREYVKLDKDELAEMVVKSSEGGMF